jgi:hypothetical protein
MGPSIRAPLAVANGKNNAMGWQQRLIRPLHQPPRRIQWNRATLEWRAVM